ncbi:MAG: glycosyltransferase family 4 protein [Winogradskyella sp.]|uniref:glycosyltransferase family 4 protein n=1 Tax=Winogradskyella sp. TaxID=1883156 RepID=UPI0025D5A844|nr:glycosyltransferase family 4 protein [Winogradskyella sp.]NRB58883.1 glycosyltransferase family 4 protein [Winogradskyella sp.]
MKLDFLVNSLMSGGAERVLVLLANYFNKKGHEVSIITFNEPDIWKPDEGIKRVRLHDGKIKNHMIRSLFNLFKYYKKKENRPDILLPFIIHTNLIGIIIGKLYKIKTVAAEHNNHLEKTDKIGKFTRKYGYRFGSALTVLTNFDKPYYKKRKVNVHTMPNPCAFDIYKEENRNRKKQIIAVGSLDRYHHKGFDNLIKIVSPVLKNHPDWKLRIVGGGEKGLDVLKDIAEQEGATDHIVFEGFSSKVSAIMRASEIFIMTSRFEGLPMVLIEAMSQGMACISYDCISGPSDIITHNVNGILVENQDSEKMKIALEELIKNPEQRIKFAKESINSLDKFNIEEIYNKFINLFKSL